MSLVLLNIKTIQQINVLKDVTKINLLSIIFAIHLAKVQEQEQKLNMEQMSVLQQILVQVIQDIDINSKTKMILKIIIVMNHVPMIIT